VGTGDPHPQTRQAEELLLQLHRAASVLYAHSVMTSGGWGLDMNSQH
jgi:hypothetical protein